MKKLFFTLLILTLSHLQISTFAQNPPIYIAFLWHMHQPIYWPYESPVATQNANRMGYSLTDIFNQRAGDYTSWPKNAVQKGIDAGFAHAGAQVSFSGSLVENLNDLESAGWGFGSWKDSWNYIKNQKTSLGNPRLDLVGFGYFHPLMGLIDYTDIRKQIQKHRSCFATNFPGTYSKGIFPPENAFSLRMIPALKDEGLEWVLVDNVHFDRTCIGYPFSTNGNLYEPNQSDIINTNPNDWKQLTGLWAPTPVSAKWGHTPHYAQYVDPGTGTVSKIIVVPGSRYLGNEDARGGFGALQYDAVMSQFESSNTDSKHPILIVLPHDGDNYGGGTDSYYGSNYDGFISWLQSNSSRFVCTTIQDYLQMFPPEATDVINIEPGSWSGADNGDPEFLKWNGDPDKSTGYSPDRNSWGVVTAAKNIMFTAEQVDANNQSTKDAWNYMLVAESSDYWYWDNSQGGLWDSHPTRACNQAVSLALPIAQGGTDLTAPTVYLPQREPYNPGGTEWKVQMPSDFTVWTYVYDLSGLKSVVLKYRTDKDGVNSLQTNDNETYTGGADVNAWQSVTMTSKFVTPTTNPLPTYKASEYDGLVSGLNNVLVDYYVEATDNKDNIAKSPIQHVWVGNTTNNGSTGTTSISWSPANPSKDDTITITYKNGTQGDLFHWGVNNATTWVQPLQAYWPAGTTIFGGTGTAVQTPFVGPDKDNTWTLKIGPFNNAGQAVTMIPFVIHKKDGTWDNNGGKNYLITINSGTIGNVSWKPVTPTTNDPIQITVSNATKSGKFHWGVNSWAVPINAYWPLNSALFSDGKSVETPFAGPDANQKLTVTVGPFNNAGQTVSQLIFVIHYDDNTWDNNTNQDYKIPVSLAINVKEPVKSRGNISVYPVPARSQAYINIDHADLNSFDIYITGLTGKLIRQFNISAENNLIPLDNIQPGIYFIVARSKDNNTILRNKIMIY